MKLSRAAWVEQEAMKLLASTRVSEPPVDPFALAAHLGFGIHYKVPMKPPCRGLWIQERAEIQLADYDVPLLRFPCAHELGHAVLGHGTDCDGVGEPTVDDFPLDEADIGPRYEPEANLFARSLLVPREWLRRDVERRMRYAELVQRYDVAKSTMIIALEKYRLVNQVRI